jgi:capsular polysaccharide transport system permease protein
LRLAFFIVLPTVLVANYFYNYATPLYATKAAFVIERGSSPSAISTGSLFSGTSLVTARESISVQEFLTSREAMRILEDELGILTHFRDPSFDAIQRLEVDASENTAYGVYKDRVLVGFDTTEGIIRLETIAATPEIARAMAQRLISLAEGRVDTMSSRSRQDAVAATQDAVDDINAQLDEQFETVLALQEELGIFSPAAEISLIEGQIGALTGELETRRLELRKLLENARPNAAQERVLRAEIAFFEEAIEERRSELIGSTEDQQSLVRVTAQLERAQNDLALLQAARDIALQNRALAEREAAQQSLYLAMVVNPVLPEVSSYPRSFEYTVLAFVIFFAIYMIASLTVSILREQMSYGTHT